MRKKSNSDTCCPSNMSSATKAYITLPSQFVMEGEQQHVLIGRYGYLNICQHCSVALAIPWEILPSSILSGQRNFGTLRKYGHIAHNTQRIATQYSLFDKLHAQSYLVDCRVRGCLTCLSAGGQRLGLGNRSMVQWYIRPDDGVREVGYSSPIPRIRSQKAMHNPAGIYDQSLIAT